jgi:hypothetical protein
MVPATLVRTGRLYSLTGFGRKLLTTRSHTQTVPLLPERRALSSRFPARRFRIRFLFPADECAGILRSEESV